MALIYTKLQTHIHVSTLRKILNMKTVSHMNLKNAVEHINSQIYGWCVLLKFWSEKCIGTEGLHLKCILGPLKKLCWAKFQCLRTEGCANTKSMNRYAIFFISDIYVSYAKNNGIGMCIISLQVLKDTKKQPLKQNTDLIIFS